MATASTSSDLAQVKVDKERSTVSPVHNGVEKLRFPTLKGDDFRHPLDQQNTRLLKALPGIDIIGKRLIAPTLEDAMYLENIASSVLVSEKQYAKLHGLVQEAAQILGVDAPDVYVRQNPVPNAYTLAINGKKPFIVVHTALMELLTPEELQAVFAHELGHLKCDHGIWLTFANLLAVSAVQLPGVGALLASSIEESLMRWVRSAELTCDRAALLVAQDPKVVMSVLMKLAGGSPSLAHELDVDAFLEQARSYDKATTRGTMGWFLRNAQTRQLTHPLPVLRAREVDKWAGSTQYKALLATRARPAVLDE